jgi:hypothetical protein
VRLAERGGLSEARLVQPERDADLQSVFRCARQRFVPARVAWGAEIWFGLQRWATDVCDLLGGLIHEYELAAAA